MVMRIGGLASGMDIDGLVEKLMSAEKAPLNKLYQSKQKYEWQRDAYRDVNKKLKSFDDFLFGNMTLTKDMYKKSVTSTNSAVSATPTSAENGQTLSINSVSQIAKSSTAVGNKIAGNTAGTTKLDNLNLGLFDSSDTAEIKLKVIQEDGKLADKTVTLSKTDSIEDMISKFKKDAGLNAFYDEKSGQIALATKHTGTGESIEGKSYQVSSSEVGGVTVESIVESTSTKSSSLYVSEGTEFLAKLGFSNSQFLGEGGQNAKFNINGAEIERSTNTFDIDGFKVTINNTYTGSQPITLTTKTDTDNMVDQIKKFVETYNGLVESFTATTKEAKYRDYTPLTDEQKKDMEKSDIEAWEEKAKSGILRSDSLVTSALSKMRGIMYENGGSNNTVLNTLYSMGITTSNKTSDNGKLVIDEDKLRAAIEKDPEAVFKTFSNTSDDQPGLVQKLRKSISTSIIGIEKKAGKSDSVNNTFNLGRTLNDTEDRITNWKRKLADIEARYWKQFGAMETAINKANQQSSTLFSGQTQ